VTPGEYNVPMISMGMLDSDWYEAITDKLKWCVQTRWHGAYCNGLCWKFVGQRLVRAVRGLLQGLICTCKYSTTHQTLCIMFVSSYARTLEHAHTPTHILSCKRMHKHARNQFLCKFFSMPSNTHTHTNTYTHRNQSLREFPRMPSTAQSQEDEVGYSGGRPIPSRTSSPSHSSQSPKPPRSPGRWVWVWVWEWG